MKRLTIVSTLWLLLATLSMDLQAQIPAPWPDSAASWGVEFQVSPDPYLPIEYYRFRYFTLGDTTIGAHTYTALYQAPNNLNPVDSTNSTYIGAFREDSAQKVWFIGPGPGFYTIYCDFPQTSGEFLLYDFGIQVGDTLDVYSSAYPDYIVYSVDTININGVNRRRWAVGNDGCNNCEHWIEGVGSDKGLFYPWCQFFEWDWHLMCFEDPDIFYDPWGFGNQCYTLVSSDEPIRKPMVEIAPNPARDQLRLSVDGSMGEKYHFQVFNSQGQMVLEKDVEGGTRQVITTAEFPRGIYHYLLSGSSPQKASGKIVLQ